MESSSSAESIKRSFEQDLDECLIRNAAALGFFARAFQQGLWQLDGDRLLALLGGVQGYLGARVSCPDDQDIAVLQVRWIAIVR